MLSGGAIAGIIIGIFVILGLSLLAVYAILRMDQIALAQHQLDRETGIEPEQNNNIHTRESPISPTSLSAPALSPAPTSLASEWGDPVVRYLQRQASTRYWKDMWVMPMPKSWSRARSPKEFLSRTKQENIDHWVRESTPAQPSIRPYSPPATITDRNAQDETSRPLLWRPLPEPQ
ncbi:hypothetical protein BT69DRAFT_1345728 [Atractiella rhizophila]|nr:hypothetical protein BT69DRAFT_1345728 [Atractiella rhizophila]